jgi:hypothetical protein
VRAGQLRIAYDQLDEVVEPARETAVRQVLAAVWDLAYQTGRTAEQEGYATPDEVAALAVLCPNVGKNPQYPCAGVVGVPCTDAVYGTPTVHAVRMDTWRRFGPKVPV